MKYSEWVRQLADSPVTYEINPALVKMAQGWGVYVSTTDRSYMTADADGTRQWVTETEVPCTRCSDCDDEILPNDVQGRLGHLFTHHGWRMNGKQYDGKNNILGEL